MASFTQDPNPTSDPSYLGFSKEPDKIKGETKVSSGDLFSSIGSTISAAANAVDRGITDLYKDRARQEIDGILADHTSGITPEEVPAIAGKFGGKGKFQTAAAEAAGADITNPEEHVPAAAQAQLSGLARLKQAVDQGTRSQAYFDTQIAAVSKKLQAEFPGYEDQVQRYISGFLGTSAANDQRKSLMSAMSAQAAASNSAGKRIEDRYYKDQDDIHALGGDKQQYLSNPDKWDHAVGDLKAKKLQLDTEAKGIALDKGRRENQGFRAVDNFTNQLDLEGATMLKGIEAQMGKAVQDQALNPNQSPEATLQAIAAARSQYVQKANELLRRPYGETGATLGGMINDTAKVNGVIESRLAVLDNLRDRIVSKDYGMAGGIARQIQYGGDVKKAELFSKVPALSYLHALNGVTDPETQKAILQGAQEDGKFLTKLGAAINQTGLLAVVDKNLHPTPPSLTQLRESHKASPNDRVPGVTTQQIVKGLNGLIDLKSNPEASARAVQSMYDQTFFSKLAASEQRDVMRMWLTPERSARVAELDKQIPGTAAHYAQFAEQAWYAVNKQNIDNARDVLTSKSSVLDFKWNEKTNQFTYTQKAEDEKNQDRLLGSRGGMAREELRIVAEFNKQAQIFTPIFKATGEDPNTGWLRLIERLEVDPDKKATPLIEHLAKAIKDKLKKLTATDDMPNGTVERSPR